MSEKIKDLIRKLDCNGPIEVQKDTIEKLIEISDEYAPLLVQPMGKMYWENAAEVLKAIGYPRNKLAVGGLFEWLRDLNWPGAFTAMESIESIEIKTLIPYLENAIKKAAEENDEMWIMALKELAINRLTIKSSDFENPELYKTLEQSE